MKKIEVCEKTGRKRVSTVNELPSKTDQSYKKQCDANYILRKYAATGQMPTHLNPNMGNYLDVSGISDLRQALQDVELAKQSFMNIPSEIRAKFGNDMAAYVEAMNDPGRAEELAELGLKPSVNNSDKASQPEGVSDGESKEGSSAAAKSN